MLIKKMKMSWVLVSDIKEARNFFEKTLGLKVEGFTPEHNWMELSTGSSDDAHLGVGQPDGASHFKAGMNAVVTFTVDNILEAQKLMKEKGVTILGDIEEVPGHVKMLTIKDKDGNIYQFCEVIGNH
jgi:predicted enzyme related to lactoylglutathione lyase